MLHPLHLSIHLRSLQLSFFRFKTLDSFHSCNCPCCVPASSQGLTPTNIVTSSPGSSSLYISIIQPGPFPLCQCSLPASPLSLNILPSFCPLRISSPLPYVCGCFPIPPVFISPMTRSRFFNGMAEVFEPEALNFFTLSRVILCSLPVSRNPTSTNLPLSGSRDPLLCDLLPLTPGLTFFLPMTRTLAVVSSYLSGKAYPSLSFLPPLSLSPSLHSDYVGSKSNKTNPPRSPF